MIFSSSSGTGSAGAAIARSTTISRNPHGQHAGDSRKRDEAEALGTQVVLFGLGVDAHAVVRLGQRGAAEGDRGGSVVGIELQRMLGREVQAVEPVPGPRGSRRVRSRGH
jgi:hypothetical protein